MKDHATDGTGGFAMIKEAGINFRHVTVYFKSQSGCDIHFSIEIFTQPSYAVPSYGVPPYPNIAAQPAGWIHSPNTYQQYAFNRN